MNLLHRYIHDLCEAMGLRDWEIILDAKPSRKDNCGEIDVIYGQHRAHMRLSRDFASYSPEKQRDTVVHELLHCHTTKIWESYQFIDGRVNPETFAIVNQAIVRDTELAVDAIAGAWSRLLPLPPVEEVTE